MTAALRVMTVFQGSTGLPEDRYVNTMHFFSGGVDDAETLGPFAAGNVETFWLDPHGTATLALGSHLSSFLEREFQIVWYDLAEATPRTPHPITSVLDEAAGTGGMPEEVAVVLSLEGAPPVTPRRRGRLYIGPIGRGSAQITSTTTGPARVATVGAGTIGVSLAEAAEFLMTDSQTDGIPWCIRSSVPSENFVPIVGGFIDNEADTQRRRGVESDARLVWPLP